MPEEKKPKIDLKARLGKTMVGMSPPAVQSTARNSSVPPGMPLPMVPGSAVPPPPMAGGVPMPPFATAAGGGHVDSNDPFSAVNPVISRRGVAIPQDFKVEVGAEAVEAARAMRRFIVIAGVAGAVLGMGMGYVFGGGAERAARERVAMEGAGLLAQDVDKANGSIKGLSDKIGEAVQSLKAKKFPENFVTDLGTVNIPFDGTKLVGKSVGSYDQQTLNLIFQYTSDVDALNTRKDALKSLFSTQKKKIIENLESGEKPVVGYTVLVIKSPKGSVASIAPIQDSFGLNGDWPKEYKMTNLVTHQVQPVTRYEAGDIYSTLDKRVGIPLEPQSVSAAFPDDVSSRVLRELAKTAEVLNGVEAGPDEESNPGLIKNGAKLSELLKKIASKKQ